MSGKRVLTIFGATGNQGGSVIDVVLARPNLAQKYALRGISRDATSGKAKGLADKGIEMVSANMDDVESLKTAVRGSYGVFGVTNFWDHLDRQREIQQGINIFDACKAEGVKHLVFSTLLSADKLTNGRLKHVDHFDAKALIGEHIEANKGDMITSRYMPAMFIEGSANAQVMNGTPTVALPFPDDNIAWPLVQPRRDGGKYVMGLFEGGEKANGVQVQGVSTWTTPKKVVETLSQVTGQNVVFYPIPADAFEKVLSEKMGPQVGKELTEMMQLIGAPGYFGEGAKEKQGESDKWLLPDSDLIGYEQWVKEFGPKKFE